MIRPIFCKFSAILMLLPVLTPERAQAFNDPNWPCAQRKVLQLSIGQVWSGPLPADGADWRADPKIAALAPILAARRTSMEEAESRISDFATGQGADLPLLFAGVFDLIERDRRRLIGGIERYAAQQRGLAEQIDVAQAALVEAKSATAEDDFDALDALEEREDKLLWDIRIYQDRNKSLTYVCESPVIIEKRAFALGRMILDAME
ncbi:MAG: hypothetical protein AAGI13_03535 [Pseudomonadota bacterium]